MNWTVSEKPKEIEGISFEFVPAYQVIDQDNRLVVEIGFVSHHYFNRPEEFEKRKKAAYEKAKLIASAPQLKQKLKTIVDALQILQDTNRAPDMSNVYKLLGEDIVELIKE